MKQFKLFLIGLFLIPGLSHAQSFSEDEKAVRAVITKLFDGMRKPDTSLLREAFAAKSIMQTIVTTKDGITTARTESTDDFIKSIGSPHKEVYDERIVFDKILIDGNLASVWTPYKFYIGERFSHCGVNSFQLLKTKQGWKIIYLIDTRRKEDCP